MNVRIHDKHVCIGLSQHELTHLAEEGRVNNMVKLGQGEKKPLIYTLEITEEEDLQVCFALNRFRILIPSSLIKVWLGNFQENYEYHISPDGRSTVRLRFEINRRQELTLREKQDRQAYLNFVN